METRAIELIKISDTEYRLSGSFTYQSRVYKTVVVDGEEYENFKVIDKYFDIDESWNNRKRLIYRSGHKIFGWHLPLDGEIIPHDSDEVYSDWYFADIDHMEIFDLPNIKVWLPSGWTRNLIFDCPCGTSENTYIRICEELDAIDAFKQIKGTFNYGKLSPYYDKNEFKVIVVEYGFNNKAWFTFDFKGIIQHDILKISEDLYHYNASDDFPGRHNKLIDRIIKDYYQKTGSITDQDRVNILANYINTL
jgi:hypothetical protein